MGNVSILDTLNSDNTLTRRSSYQGAKAAQKRERNADKASKGSKSQAKSNEAAKNIVCSVCKQPFVSNIFPFTACLVVLIAPDV